MGKGVSMEWAGADRRDHAEVDVLVVGAGPVGLVIANLLGTYGLSALVVERAAELAGAPRAVALDDEGMRTLQLAGLADAAAAHMLLGYDHHFFGRRGQLLLKVDPAGREHGWPKRNRFHQPILERCLIAGLDRFAEVTVAFGQRLTGFETDPAGVSAVIESVGGERQVRARFLIGADGGSSTVRRLAGIAMAGESHPDPWIVIDTEDNADTARFSRAIGDPARPSVNVPGTEGRRRYEFMLLPGEDPDEATGDAAVAQLLRPHCDLARVRVTRRAVYTFHSLIAERFATSDARVFLAGDAAHMMPPFQGQGMNSGMRDAAMLAWRIAAVVQGRMGSGVLGSYNTERRPHAVEMMRLSQRVGRILMTRDPVRAWIRDLAFATLGRLPGPGRYLREMRFKPRPSAADGFFLPGNGQLFPQPDVLTVDGARVPLDRMLGSGFALLHLREVPRPVEASYTHPFWKRINVAHVQVLPGGIKAGGPVTTIADIGGTLAAGPGGRTGVSLLLRPDRYVAATIASGEEDRVAAALDAMAPI